MLNLFTAILARYESPRRHGLDVEFYPYVSLKHTIRLKNGRYLLRISDLMIGSPPDALEAVAHIMFSKVTGRACPPPFEEAYSLYANSPRALRKLERAARERGWRFVYGSRGDCRNLDASFERVNQRYFRGRIRRPDLTWTRTRSRSRLGLYDGTFNVLAISRRLDSRRVPLYVLDYVVYHEMLHMVYPIEIRDGRRHVHTRGFLEAERRYEHYDRAMKWLNRG